MFLAPTRFKIYSFVIIINHSKIIGFVSKTIEFVSKTIGFVSKMIFIKKTSSWHRNCFRIPFGNPGKWRAIDEIVP
jgi:hypothetical protein